MRIIYGSNRLTKVFIKGKESEIKRLVKKHAANGIQSLVDMFAQLPKLAQQTIKENLHSLLTDAEAEECNFLKDFLCKYIQTSESIYEGIIEYFTTNGMYSAAIRLSDLAACLFELEPAQNMGIAVTRSDENSPEAYVLTRGNNMIVSNVHYETTMLISCAPFPQERTVTALKGDTLPLFYTTDTLELTEYLKVPANLVDLSLALSRRALDGQTHFSELEVIVAEETRAILPILVKKDNELYCVVDRQRVDYHTLLLTSTYLRNTAYSLVGSDQPKDLTHLPKQKPRVDAPTFSMRLTPRGNKVACIFLSSLPDELKFEFDGAEKCYYSSMPIQGEQLTVNIGFLPHTKYVYVSVGGELHEFRSEGK